MQRSREPGPKDRQQGVFFPSCFVMTSTHGQSHDTSQSRESQYWKTYGDRKNREGVCLSVCLCLFLRKRMFTCLGMSTVNKNNIIWHIEGGIMQWATDGKKTKQRKLLFILGTCDRSAKNWLKNAFSFHMQVQGVCESRHPGISGVFLVVPPCGWAMWRSSNEWTAGPRLLGGSLAPWRTIFKKGLG